MASTRCAGTLRDPEAGFIRCEKTAVAEAYWPTTPYGGPVALCASHLKTVEKFPELEVTRYKEVR